MCGAGGQHHLLVADQRDGLLKQSSFYPFQLVSNHARGQALDVQVNAPLVDTAKYGPVSTLDVSSSYDAESGTTAVFIVNRSQTETVATDLIWQAQSPKTITQAVQLAGADVKAANTWQNPDHITAQAIEPPTIDDGQASMQLPPLSYTVLVASVS